MKKHLLSQRTLRNWLKNRPDNEIVGRASQSNDCPCQRCIVELNPEVRNNPIRVYEADTRVFPVLGSAFDPPLRILENPGWLERFVRIVDKTITGPVTAKQARSILWRASHPEKVAA